MKRIDQVREALQGQPAGEVTASELAGQLGLSRANVSSDLNRLCEMGLAQKRGTKPVYYSAAVRQEEALNELELLMKKSPSLHQSGELAKAAVLYPPHGMHVMLFGDTGVGKSMFARCVYQYAVAKGRMPDENKFVAFNCADYANNPQLLVSQLFGVAKGAYTGADEDKPGLIEKADGGILFLDEVHRFPPEGQEMLFSYIDYGCYRRMGETQSERTAHVMLICATTEDPSSALLQTFTRRIPMSIRIPNLAERTVEERLGLIAYLFNKQAGRLSHPVHVTVNSLRALLGYECKGNIGQLESDIQMLCARAYSEFVAGKAESISITSFSLPPHIRSGIYTQENRRKIWARLAGITTRFVSFDANSEVLPPVFEQDNADIYEMIETRTEDMRRVGISQEQIDETINTLLAEYFNSYRKQDPPLADTTSVEHFVGSEVMATSGKLMALAQKRLGVKFSENTRYGVAMHLFNAIKRVRQGHNIVNPRLQDIRNEHPEAYAAAMECLEIVERDFNLRLPQDEAAFLALFLTSADLGEGRRRPVLVVVLAHGSGVATGLADTANRLLGSPSVKGFDVPLENSADTVYAELRGYVESLGNVQEVLLLVDMGSLVNFASDLERDLGVRTRCFVMVSTLHVLEAARKAAMGYSLHDVYQDTKKMTELALSEVHTEAGQTRPETLYLLTVCTTGEGSAKVLKELLAKGLDLKAGRCEIVSLQLTDRGEFASRVERLSKTGNIIGVVSSFNTSLPVPHFHLGGVLDGSGLANIQAKIDTEDIFLQVSHTLIPMLESIEPGVAARDIRATIERIGRALRMEIGGEMLIGVFCHIGCMLDRLKRGEDLNQYPGRDELLAKYPQEVGLIQHECSLLAEQYGVHIPLDEVCYISAFYLKEDLLPGRAKTSG